jgi:hypothetical protein
MGGACSTHEEIRNAYKILIGKPERKRPPGRSRRSWKFNIKFYLKDTEYEDVE